MNHDVAEPATRLRERVLGCAGELLARVAGDQEVPVVSENAALRAGLTSAIVLELLLELEEALGIEVDVEELDEDDTATFGTLADFVVAHSRPAS